MRRRLAALLVGAALVAACAVTGGGPAATPEPVKRELTMALVPSSQAQTALANAQPLADYLSKQIGTPVRTLVPTSYAAVVEGLASNVLDIAWVEALAYVAASNKGVTEVVTRSARCGPTYSAAPPAPECTPRPTYPAIIVCGTSAAVPDLKDSADWSPLKGKRFVLGDSLSVSGNLWPRYYLKRNKIDADRDFSRVASVSSAGAVALAVYNGATDCGAMFGDARLTVVRAAPDIFARTKVVFIAPEEIPGDPQIVRRNLSPRQKSRVRTALIQLGSDPSMKTALDALYQIAATKAAPDADYDTLRRVVTAVNPNVLSEVIAPPSPGPPGNPTG